MMFLAQAGPATAKPLSAGASPIRVMICDDSAVIRVAISRMLQTDPDIIVVARTANGRLALDELSRTPADVLVLDIEMPVMDGITALPLLLRADPHLRVVMASTLTTRGADIAMQALRLGAADYVPKPSANELAGDSNFQQELIAKIKGLGRLRRRSLADLSEQRRAAPLPGQAAVVAAPAIAAVSGPPLRPAPAALPRLLAIGSSTGGPAALFVLLAALSRKLPVPVVITQHMPPNFTTILAEHITKLGAMPCAEAVDGEKLAAGRIYLAPGGHHLLIRSREHGTTDLHAAITDDPPENYCRPAVDPMLRSATEATGGRVLVVMLTGMGQDGLAGTRAVIEAGGAAMAQDEASSVVWGMPGAVARAGLCHAVLPLPAIAPRIHDLFRVRP